MNYKSNKDLSFYKDNIKSYVFIKEGKKDVGILMWHYGKKKWVLEGIKDEQPISK